MSSWRECKLGDVAEIIDSLHKTPKEYFTTGYPMVRVTDVKRGKLNLSKTLKVNKETFEEFSKKYKPKKDDIIFTRVGSYGNTCIVGDDINFCLGQNTVFIIPRENAKFLYYFFNSPDAKVQIEASVSGSTQPTVSLKSIREYDISLPPLKEQKAIAEILSSLDDKIDLLHRQNQTLESLAQTLFRQWFIEEAKEEWEVGKLSDYIDIVDNRGKTPPISDDITKYPIIEVNALSGESRLVNYSVIKKHVTEDVYNSWFRAGHPKLYDTLLSTVGSIGEIAMFLLEKGSIAQNVVALRAKNISPFYLYENIKFMQNELKELDIGSVQPSIKVTQYNFADNPRM